MDEPLPLPPLLPPSPRFAFVPATTSSLHQFQNKLPFRCNSTEDTIKLLSSSSLILEKKNYTSSLTSWYGNLSQSTTYPIWIWLCAFSYHRWSKNILFTLVIFIGNLIKLDDVTATQIILIYSRVCIDLICPNQGPKSSWMNIEVESSVLINVKYEYSSCSKSLRTSHASRKCSLSLVQAPTPNIPPPPTSNMPSQLPSIQSAAKLPFYDPLSPTSQGKADRVDPQPQLILDAKISSRNQPASPLNNS